MSDDQNIAPAIHERKGHTPGPWTAIKHSEPNDDMRCAVVANRGKLAYLVATIENGAPGDYCDTEWSNALLIAALPEMLAALEMARVILMGTRPGFCMKPGGKVVSAGQALAAVEDAITKAGG